MISLRPSPVEVQFLDTPRGIRAADGTLFSIRENELREWADGVLSVAPINTLIGEVLAGLTLAESLLLWVAPVVFLLFESVFSLVALVAIYPLLRILFAPLTSGILIAAAKYLNVIALQGIYYVVFLSLISQNGHVLAVILALAFFVLIRLHILGRLFEKPIRYLSSRVYRLSLEDVALRSRILNIATLHGITLEGSDSRNLKVFSWRA